MFFLRRVGDVLLLWLPVVVAILVCYAVSAWSSAVRPLPDAGAPIPALRPGERRGPSVEELIERLDRQRAGSAGRASWAE
jgi:hypothetical protein